MGEIRRSHNHDLRWPRGTPQSGAEPHAGKGSRRGSRFMKASELLHKLETRKELKAYSRWGIGALALLLVTAGVAFFAPSRNSNSVEAHGGSSDNSPAAVTFAAPGRVEGASETTQVGAAADGILKAVFVKEGQFVKKGTLLGEIGCDELQASLQTALAEADGARQAKARLMRGARDEERKIASDKTAAARATYEEAKSHLEMQRALYEKQQISRSAYD